MGAALQRRVAGKGVVVSAVHPGFVSTCAALTAKYQTKPMQYVVKCMHEHIRTTSCLLVSTVLLVVRLG